jgi:hypothetical protein
MATPKALCLIAQRWLRFLQPRLGTGAKSIYPEKVVGKRFRETQPFQGRFQPSFYPGLSRKKRSPTLGFETQPFQDKKQIICGIRRFARNNIATNTSAVKNKRAFTSSYPF